MGAAEGPCSTCLVLWQLPACPPGLICYRSPENTCPAAASPRPRVSPATLRLAPACQGQACKVCLRWTLLATASEENIVSNPRFQLHVVFVGGGAALACLSSHHHTQRDSVERGPMDGALRDEPCPEPAAVPGWLHPAPG